MLRTSDENTISYAFDVTAETAFVATESAAAVGSEVELELSFPRLLEPVTLSARVEERCDQSGPGAPAGLRLRFAPHEQLSQLLARAHDVSNAALRACRILLVEDNDFIRDVFDYGLRAFFEARGAYTVDHAGTVESAWQLLGESSYDVAIVDYYLPSETGASLIERIRREDRMAQLPIVAVSVGGRDAREASLAAGADLFLDKPLVFRDLFNTLRILSESASGASAAPKKTILVFDDSPMILELTRAALEAAGFQVAIAEDLATFEQHRGTLDPDLILVDVQMPEAFGDDVVLTLREGHGVRVPILLVSSLEESELATRAERARAAGYIQKKAGMSELVRRCKEVLEVAV
ncbi:MAG TPA: response regulator [Kofleriaceae bacterium]|nr:response regulator [Kofleriaceae bacterium]